MDILDGLNFDFSKGARLEVDTLLVHVRIGASCVHHDNSAGKLGLDLRSEAVVALHFVMALIKVTEKLDCEYTLADAWVNVEAVAVEIERVEEVTPTSHLLAWFYYPTATLQIEHLC